ncbi:MAG: MMPL family transporter, partial [Planctomycetota bacterium]|nr:MMPL family transporter [Planctomycetota bacterium]
QKYVNDVINNPAKGKYDYNGDVENLKRATQEQKLEHWYNFFKKIGQSMPPRQTAIVVVLNTPVLGELNRAVGREILGKPMGRIRYLATNECDISKHELHLGGPPCDNVAIDEEGTITLVRLLGLSTLVGLSIAYLSFRSVIVTLMVFFVGGVSAIASLGLVWYGNSQLDAILLTMPSLVYVLGLSGAVHIVNYYREACYEDGHRAAAETAVRYGWFPCTLAALTTALGLISLYVSNLIPIKKFGLFSAIGTMITVSLLFTYLPASLKLFPPGYKKRRKRDLQKKQGRSLYDVTNAFWAWIGNWVIKRHALVTGVVLVLMSVAALGIFKIKTSVQLIKLFDQNSNVVQDYIWMEKNLGKLVPMEIIVGFDKDVIENNEDLLDAQVNLRELQVKYSRLDRIEAAELIGDELDRAFGEIGKDIVGKRLSTGAFLPFGDTRRNKNAELINAALSKNRETLLKIGTHGIEVDDDIAAKNYGHEFWRISLRLGSLNNVDYGLFVSDLKRVVEPVLSAMKYRTEILTKLTEKFENQAEEENRQLGPTDEMSGSFYLLGFDHGPTPKLQDANLKSFLWKREYFNQTHIFCRSIYDFLSRRGFSRKGSHRGFDFNNPAKVKLTASQLQEKLDQFDCVVLIQDDETYDIDFIKQHAKIFVDARDHRFNKEWTNDDIITTREMRWKNRESGNVEASQNVNVVATYSGIVPIVYKAQRSLLRSLIDSICLAFVMIAFVMMLLLRDWKRKVSAGNLVNVSGGLVSMLPNIFPVVLIFGMFGHLGVSVDIGSMMTASVAMGVAVDDTIHFLNWFRKGLRDNLSRHDAIRLAYKRCGAAMTQTTMIGGLGLCVFGLSTFTPTQRFGILMLVLLVAALVGDLIFLPAILAGPLGKLFAFSDRSLKRRRTDTPIAISTREQLDQLDADRPVLDDLAPGSGIQSTPHSGLKDAIRKKNRVDSD